jgi:hypothetical protein
MPIKGIKNLNVPFTDDELKDMKNAKDEYNKDKPKEEKLNWHDFILQKICPNRASSKQPKQET